MNGLELCKEIRNGSTKGYVFMVLLTAKDSKDDMVSGFEAGVDDYLIKPPNYAELTARIKTGMRILELERRLLKANEEIKVLSNTDTLTGLFNRGYLKEVLPKEFKKSVRYKKSISVAMCDIDHFKRVNCLLINKAVFYHRVFARNK